MFRPKSLFSFLSPPFGSLSLHPITANSAGSTFEYISQIQQLLSSHPLTSLVHFISIICLVSCLPLPLVVTFTSALVLCSHSCHEDALKRRVKAGHFSAQNPPTASNKITVRVLTQSESLSRSLQHTSNRTFWDAGKVLCSGLSNMAATNLWGHRAPAMFKFKQPQHGQGYCTGHGSFRASGKWL